MKDRVALLEALFSPEKEAGKLQFVSKYLPQAGAKAVKWFDKARGALRGASRAAPIGAPSVAAPPPLPKTLTNPSALRRVGRIFKPTWGKVNLAVGAGNASALYNNVQQFNNQEQMRMESAMAGSARTLNTLREMPLLDRLGFALGTDTMIDGYLANSKDPHMMRVGHLLQRERAIAERRRGAANQPGWTPPIFQQVLPPALQDFYKRRIKDPYRERQHHLELQEEAAAYEPPTTQE